MLHHNIIRVCILFSYYRGGGYNDSVCVVNSIYNRDSMRLFMNKIVDCWTSRKLVFCIQDHGKNTHMFFCIEAW